MSKIDAAIFDIGNVLLPFDYSRSAQRLIEKNNLTAPPERSAIAAIQTLYETGAMSRVEFVRRIRTAFQDVGEESDFITIWEEIFEGNPAINMLAERLAQRIPLYLLSNIGDIHHEYVFRTYPIFRLFRDGIFSYRARMLKPDPQIFDLAITQFGVNPARTLYLDDMPEHVASARSRGLFALQYDVARHAEIEAQVLALFQD